MREGSRDGKIVFLENLFLEQDLRNFPLVSLFP